MKLSQSLCAAIVTPLMLVVSLPSAAADKTLYFKKDGDTVRNVHVIQETHSGATNEDRYYLNDYASCFNYEDGIGQLRCKIMPNGSVNSYTDWGGQHCDAAGQDAFWTTEENKIRDKLKKNSQRATAVVEDSGVPVWVRYKQDGDEYFACMKPSELANGQVINLQGFGDNSKNASLY